MFRQASRFESTVTMGADIFSYLYWLSFILYCPLPLGFLGVCVCSDRLLPGRELFFVLARYGLSEFLMECVSRFRGMNS